MDQEEQNDWLSRSGDERYINWIQKVHTRPLFDGAVVNPFGGIELESSGYLKVNDLLDSFGELLKAKKCCINDRFDEKKLVLKDNGVEYGNIHASKLIFCTGFSNETSYFDWLPFSPVKGEIIEIKTAVSINKIVNRGVFVMPKEPGRYRVGATYNWNDLTTVPTKEARVTLEEKLKKLLAIPYEVVDQSAGIRPATMDRRPFVGMHPEYKQIGIFGGLGTKGVSLAPYFSQQFVDYLVTNKELQEEVNISRYKSLYYR